MKLHDFAPRYLLDVSVISDHTLRRRVFRFENHIISKQLTSKKSYMKTSWVQVIIRSRMRRKKKNDNRLFWLIFLLIFLPSSPVFRTWLVYPLIIVLIILKPQYIGNSLYIRAVRLQNYILTYNGSRYWFPFDHIPVGISPELKITPHRDNRCFGTRTRHRHHHHRHRHPAPSFSRKNNATHYYICK